MDKRKLIFSSGIAGVFEWYDYTLFGHFARIWSKHFFPDDDFDVSMLKSFAIFAMGYLMRPLGGIFFGIIGDKFGRKTALSTSVMCMAIPTAIIGLLPTYNQIGSIATLLMIIARMVQGLSMGGALTGSMSFIIEHTSPKHRGLIGSIPMTSICVGILLGSLASTITQSFLSPEDFESWGWRIPFLMGIIVIYAGLYIKKHTQETPMFKRIKRSNSIERSPLKVVFRDHWKDMLISIFINSTGSVIFYLQAIYLINYLNTMEDLPGSTINFMVNVSYILMAITTLLSGWLSDIFGRKKMYIILNAAIMISIFSVMDMFSNGSVEGIWVAQIVLSVMAAMYIGAEPALQTELYPTNIRNTALSLSYNIATSLFGGTAPYVFHSLVYNTGMVTSASYYIVTCSFLSLIALFFYKKE